MKEFNFIEFIKKHSNTICSVLFVFIIILFSVRSVQEAYFTLPSFDGAMNLQVPVNLIKYGRYATSYYNTIIDFDHSIQSGIPFLLPIYLMFLAFGKSAFVAQLVNSIYMILTVIVIYYLISLNANKLFALACLLFVMPTPYLLRYGHHIYGEIPALFYFLLSLLMLNKLQKRSNGYGILLPLSIGFSYGLSYLTKTVMLIAAPSLIFFLMVDLLYIHKLQKKHYLLMLIGFIVPIVAFECYKIIQLGTDVYLGWWNKQYFAIMPHVGVEKKYNDTAHIFAKMLKHTREFCKFFRMNTFTMLCFLCIPPLIFIVNYSYCFIQRKREKANLSLAIVCGTACTYMVWWIFMTPTARAWPRRIINGYILQEIAFVLSLYLLWKFLSTTKYKLQFLKTVVVGGVFTTMLLVILFQGAVNIKRVKFLSQPSPEKLNAEKMARTLERLPEKAKICGVGWWQAPILSFLSNRVFVDLLQHKLPEYPVKLQDTYVVIDYPDALEHVTFSVLSKTKNSLIEKQGYNYLYQIEYISDYLYANTYRNNRARAMTWLANQVTPSDKVVIAEELQVNEYEQRTLYLKAMYLLALSKEFKKLKQDDLTNAADYHILKKLQRSPKFVYKKPTLAYEFFKNNNFKIWPEIIFKEGNEITKKWVADNFVTYAVGYDNKIVDDNAPFYDPQFRKSLKIFPLANTKSKKSFSIRRPRGWILNKEPKINIYKFDNTINQGK